jgi:hypothetical protein
MAAIAAFFGIGFAINLSFAVNLSWEGAKILFFVFLVLAVLSCLVDGSRRRTFVG